MKNCEISNTLTKFITENAHFDSESNLLFTVSVKDNSELAEEMKIWVEKDCKLNFGGLVGIKILSHQKNGEDITFSFSSEYFKMNIMEFKRFVKKEKESIHEYKRDS
jgi:hypothetical protein